MYEFFYLCYSYIYICIDGLPRDDVQAERYLLKAIAAHPNPKAIILLLPAPFIVLIVA